MYVLSYEFVVILCTHIYCIVIFYIYVNHERHVNSLLFITVCSLCSLVNRSLSTQFSKIGLNCQSVHFCFQWTLRTDRSSRAWKRCAREISFNAETEHGLLRAAKRAVCLRGLKNAFLKAQTMRTQWWGCLGETCTTPRPDCRLKTSIQWS